MDQDEVEDVGISVGSLSDNDVIIIAKELLTDAGNMVGFILKLLGPFH